MRAPSTGQPATLTTVVMALLCWAALLGAGRAQPLEQPSLDDLFAALSAAADPASAQQISDQIWIAWTHPADPDLVERMEEVLLLRSVGHLTLVLERLDGIVAEFPDYAEGWNQRATVHFMLNDYDASLADIERTLALEPRHYGALSGRAMIYLAQDKRALALKDITKALKLHPFLAERGLFPELENLTQI